MLLGIVIAQLFGIQRETREANIRMKYATNPSPELEELGVLVFFIYVAIGTFAWPVSPTVTLWKSGHPIWSITFAIFAMFFFIGALPFYLIWGFSWSVIKFGMTYL